MVLNRLRTEAGLSLRALYAALAVRFPTLPGRHELHEMGVALR